MGHPPDIPGTVRMLGKAAGWGGKADLLFPRELAVFALQWDVKRFLHGGPLPQETALLTLICRWKGVERPLKVRLVAPAHIDTLLPRFTLEGVSEELLVRPRQVRVVVRLRGEEIAASEPVLIERSGDRKVVRLRLPRYGPEVEVSVEDVQTGEVLERRLLEVTLPSGYEETPL